MHHHKDYKGHDIHVLGERHEQKHIQHAPYLMTECDSLYSG